MSELKITISQLEDLLDRQKELVIESLEMASKPIHMRGTVVTDKDYFYVKDKDIRPIGLKANYPHEFNILKRYVK